MLLLLVVLLVILATLLLGWACFGFCRRARNECNADNAADEFYSEPKPKAALPPPTAHRLCLCHCHCRVSTSTGCSCCAFNESFFNRHSFVVRVLANPVQNFLCTHAALSICYCCARCDVSATRSSWFKAVLAACHSLAFDFPSHCCCCCCFFTYARSVQDMLGRRRLIFGHLLMANHKRGGLQDNEIRKIIWGTLQLALYPQLGHYFWAKLSNI